MPELRLGWDLEQHEVMAQTPINIVSTGESERRIAAFAGLFGNLIKEASTLAKKITRRIRRTDDRL